MAALDAQLIQQRDRVDVWQERMDAYGVKYRDRSCVNGKPGFTQFTGAYAASGCYVNEDGRASLRYVVPPWDNCMNLKAGARRIEYPTLYIAVLGPDDGLAKLTSWAEPEGSARPEALYKHFRQRVDACGFTPPM